MRLYTRVHSGGKTKGVVRAGGALADEDEAGIGEMMIVDDEEVVDGADIAEVELGCLSWLQVEVEI